MQDPDPDPNPNPSPPEDSGTTVELTLPQNLPATPKPDPRSHLPGLEPERRVTDWGRSERIEGLVDRTLYDFLYHYWFRVETEGLENVPARGGALLVANHGGALAADAAMIAKAIAEEHPDRRSVQLTTGRFLTGVPGVGMVATKLGAVALHPANLQRLLFDEGQLVLVFPEGRRAATKGLKDRYRLRRFGGSGFVEAAMRARVPIVPLAVLGAEEALPVFARVNLLRRLTRLERLPITSGIPLPAKIRIRFLEPIATVELGPRPWDDGEEVQTLGDDIRALIQENVLELVAQRRSVWLG